MLPLLHLNVMFRVRPRRYRTPQNELVVSSARTSTRNGSAYRHTDTHTKRETERREEREREEEREAEPEEK